MMGVWSHLRQFMYTKFIVVVDDDVDVCATGREVIWAITTRMDPARDTMMVDTPIDYLDFASPVSGLGNKMGMDATKQMAGETQRNGVRPMHDAEVSARAEALMGAGVVGRDLEGRLFEPTVDANILNHREACRSPKGNHQMRHGDEPLGTRHTGAQQIPA